VICDRVQVDGSNNLAEQLARLDQVLALKHTAHVGNGLSELCFRLEGHGLRGTSGAAGSGA
jgi:hypothetical protein